MKQASKKIMVSQTPTASCRLLKVEDRNFQNSFMGLEISYGESHSPMWNFPAT